MSQITYDCRVKLRVESYAGYRGEQEPRSFWLGERKMEVVTLEDRWLAPNHRYFKCKAQDGNFYILHHNETTETWELGAYTRAS